MKYKKCNCLGYYSIENEREDWLSYLAEYVLSLISHIVVNYIINVYKIERNIEIFFNIVGKTITSWVYWFISLTS